jgi:hypothetical protein
MKPLRILVVFAALPAFLLAVGCGDDDGGDGNDQEICDNNQDDDGDGQPDCLDPDCTNHSHCQTTNCDNDDICEASQGENATNCPNDCGSTAEICDNQVDDDGDNQVDCNDTDCANDAACNTVCNNDGTCDTTQGENETNCPADCGSTGSCSTPDDMINQNGCSTGEKCTVVDPENDTIGCANDGTVDAWQPCGAGGVDDCMAGMLCLPEEQGSQNSVCTPMCAPQSVPCPTGSTCSVDMQITQNLRVTVCAQSDNCDPVDYDVVCNTGEGCYVASQQGDTICAQAGSGTTGTACQYTNDCAAGFTCGQNGCIQLCKGDPDCDTGTCQGIGQAIPGWSDIGVCQ